MTERTLQGGAKRVDHGKGWTEQQDEEKEASLVGEVVQDRSGRWTSGKIQTQ